MRPRLISGKTVAIIGFGSQGHATPRTARERRERDSQRPAGTQRGRRQKAGFEILTAAEPPNARIGHDAGAGRGAGRLYKSTSPNLKAGMTLMFAHASTSTSARSCRRPTWTSAWSPPRARPHRPPQYTEGKACRASSPSTRCQRHGQAVRAGLCQGLGATRAGVIETTSRKRPRPISSASRPCSARLHRPGQGRLRHPGRAGTSRRSPTSSASTSSS